MELLAEYAEYPVETGLLSKLLSEAKTLSLGAKAQQLFKKRRQRQARRLFRVKSLRRSTMIKGKSINKRKAALFKAGRKRSRTKRLFGRRKR